jgi:hypothetical protein
MPIVFWKRSDKHFQKRIIEQQANEGVPLSAGGWVLAEGMVRCIACERNF